MTKTMTYLSKILRSYPNNFKDPYFKMRDGGFIVDYYVCDAKYFEINGFKPYIFIKAKANEFVALIKKTKYCKDVYIFDKHQILVIEIDNEWIPAYTNFLLSNYSKMFDKKDFRRLDIRENINGKKGICYAVLLKTDIGREYLKQKVKEDFGTTLEDSDINENVELDTPLNWEECLRGEDYPYLQNIISNLKNK